ncbi:MAG: DUF1801 domain-containing protein [Paracoccaceae bacterium]
MAAPNKTQPTPRSVEAFLASVAHPTRRADAQALDALFRRVTGWAPRMWGEAIVGYGSYDYRYASGRAGTFLATGFSPRKANLSLYIMPGYHDMGSLLERLGKHRCGKACLYVNTLADVDAAVIEEIVAEGLRNLRAHWPVRES